MKISVVIPNYNGKNLLKKNLPKVIEACKDCEIIVVDDASTDGSTMLLKKEFPQVKIIQHASNMRFATACNTGVKRASGEVVILLNSDVAPRKDFLEPLIKHFKNSEVFSIGCKEIEKKGDREIISGRTEGKFERGFLIHWRPKNQESQDTLWTFGGSMAVDRRKYLKLGGMDKLYSPAYWEDNDLCWRASQKGWKMIFEKDAVVYHNHETTNVSVFGRSYMRTIAHRNHFLFMWKNIRGEELKNHFLWLPYHLTVGSIKTRGKILTGFAMAIPRFVLWKLGDIN
jgi:GT2 family glycosyltransferase